MRLLTFMVSCVLLAASCAVPRRQSFDDALVGRSHAKAIRLRAASHGDGLELEHAWLRQHFPGARLAEAGTDAAGEEVVFLPHRTESVGGVIYSVYTMQLTNGRVIDVFFDQSEYFGKYDDD